MLVAVEAFVQESNDYSLKDTTRLTRFRSFCHGVTELSSALGIEVGFYDAYPGSVGSRRVAASGEF
jgi:hypothetical protein